MLLEFGLEPAGVGPAPCRGVTEKVEDDGAGAVGAVVLVDVVQAEHGLEVGHRAKVGAVPCAHDVVRDAIDGSHRRASCLALSSGCSVPSYSTTYIRVMPRLLLKAWARAASACLTSA